MRIYIQIFTALFLVIGGCNSHTVKNVEYIENTGTDGDAEPLEGDIWSQGGLVEGDVVEEAGIAEDWNKHELIISVQESLDELGYGPGNTKGRVDYKTQQSVRQYRIDHKLDVNDEINTELESHINSFVWETRNQKSINPREVALVIVKNRHEEECSRLLSENFSQTEFPEPDNDLATIYIYRMNNSEGKRPDYPISLISLNGRSLGKLDHNDFIKVEANPGKLIFTEDTEVELKNKDKIDFATTVEANKNYFLQLSVGKYKKSGTVSDSAPFYIGYGVLDILISELVWDVMNKSKQGGTFHFAQFLESSEGIGKCHITMISSSPSELREIAAKNQSKIRLNSTDENMATKKVKYKNNSKVINEKAHMSEGHETIPYPAPDTCIWIRDSKTQRYELDC